MDLGSLTLKAGTISESAGRKTDDNTVAEKWIADCHADGGKAKALTVPGTVGKNPKGKTVYTGVANEVVTRLRRAVDTFNEGATNPDDMIGLRLEVVPAGKDKVTVNFALGKKIFRPRKPKTDGTPETTPETTPAE